MKQRAVGLDILKTVASFFVLTLHMQVRYFDSLPHALNGSLYTLIFFAVRYTTMACIPLFLLITGYLQCHKKISKAFIQNLLPILLTYGIICVAGECFLHAGSILTDGFGSSVRRIFDFSSNGYAWYVEMFIGLYLCIPLLNNGFNTFTPKQQRFTLLILGFFMMIPTVFQTFNLPIYMPDYWIPAYPVFYYLTGSYIRQNHVSPSKRILCIGLAAWIALPIVLQYCLSPNGAYVWYVMTGFNALSGFMIALHLFLLFYKLHGLGKFTTFLFKTLASASLGVYLSSYYWEFWVCRFPTQGTRAVLLQLLLLYAVSAASGIMTERLTHFLIYGIYKLKSIIKS